MARSKTPKNDSVAKETVISGSPAGVSENKIQPAEAVAPAPSRETRSDRTVRGARRPEVVKAESRMNLVPINLEDEIRRLAYLLSEKRGFEPGHETEDWLAAELEVKQRYLRQSALATSA